VPPGEPPAPQPEDAPQPEETLKDQLLRTFTAVRTRLRHASAHTDEVQADEASENGDERGNGSRPSDVAETVAPLDPLLAERASTANGDEPAAPAGEDWWAVAVEGASEPVDMIIEQPPLVDEPTHVDEPPFIGEPPVTTESDEPAPATIVAPIPVPDGAVPVSKPARARRRRIRPALPLLRRRPRVRKVTRIVRRVDAWGVFKISVIFYVILYIILLVAGVLLWNLANTTGTVANIEGFVRDLFGLETFEFDGEKIFRASWVLGAILVVAGTGLNVTLAILFNLISDLVGGVRVTVLEEEVVLRERPVLPPPLPSAAATENVTEIESEPPGEPDSPPADTTALPAPEPLPEPATATIEAADPLLAETPRRRRVAAASARRTSTTASRRSSGRGPSNGRGRRTQPGVPEDLEGG
jgi:hypothetical protein